MPTSNKLPIGILLSLSTAPLLLVLIGSRALAKMVQDMGQTSEEVFRGERLPVLKISPSRFDNKNG
ncbi:hypothetical protein [Leptolyngbya sp. 7M]|uniref:hypothetical protein n=1 Tax=Leptolyngbya sp. 7M TaxID=2812896 RepID=UPI001B8AD972|nr:hypothetical protein [Leptolyngbya sp. 7M]QYO63509.1 hypothetical protein JVX88_27005 [Leptolyngbya sp. 7M]